MFINHYNNFQRSSYNEGVRKYLLIILVALAVGTAFYAIKNTNVTKVITEIGQSKIYVQKDSNADFFPDWTAEDLLAKINAAREASGASTLKSNTKLDQAALARLSVILTENDVDGAKTGLTSSKVLTSVDYDASMVGELILTSFFKTNDPIAFWDSNASFVSTLNYKDFQEVGIAIKNSTDRVDIYVLLVTPRKIIKQAIVPQVTWGGPDLWAVINKRRVEMGVNPLKQMDLLCTIASIRLNELLQLGKLDGHEGFVPVLERSDLKDQTANYNISEFLIQGYQTPEAAVDAWENTMGHKALLAGGEYVWGCVYAQNTFGVAIAAY